MPEKSKSAYNETGKGEEPEVKDLYYNYEEMHRGHGMTDNFETSVNAESGRGIMGGGVKHRGQPSLKK